MRCYSPLTAQSDLLEPRLWPAKGTCPVIRLIRTWELLRFHSKLEKSSDEVEDVKDDRPIDPASKQSTFWPRV